MKKNTKIKKAKCGKGLKKCVESSAFFIRSATECISNLKIPNTGRKTQKERSFTVLWGVLWSSSRKDKTNSSVLRFGSILMSSVDRFGHSFHCQKKLWENKRWNEWFLCIYLLLELWDCVTQEEGVHFIVSKPLLLLQRCSLGKHWRKLSGVMINDAFCLVESRLNDINNTFYFHNLTYFLNSMRNNDEQDLILYLIWCVCVCNYYLFNLTI